MYKKGFTLIELMAVIAIISLITIISIPVIKNIVSSQKQKEYNVLVDNIKSAAKIYISNNPDLLNNTSQGCIQTVTIATLQDAKLLEKNLVDPINKTVIEATEHIDICVSGDEITYVFPGN